MRVQIQRTQHGSVLLVALVFLLVLSRMAQGGLDAALTGVQLVFNYRAYDRAYAEAENIIVLVDANLMSAIGQSGVTTGIASKAQHNGHSMAATGNGETVSFHIDPLWPGIDVWSENIQGQPQCSAMYRITAVAEGVRVGTKIRLTLERQVCCEDWVDCEQGVFMSTSTNVWRN